MAGIELIIDEFEIEITGVFATRHAVEVVHHAIPIWRFRKAGIGGFFGS